MAIIVQKYGGSSVATQDQLRNIAENIRSRVHGGDKLIVVVSAMGNTTDDLLEKAFHASENPPKREVDMLISTGERVTMALLAIHLDHLAIPTQSLTGSQSGILTDKVHGNARIGKVLGNRIQQAIERCDVVIVAGFQGYCPDSGEITTLGRGGTDLTAVALAARFGAKAVEFYKDVPGILVCDPRVVDSTRPIASIGIELMEQMAWSGAGVLHHRCLHVAKKSGISLKVFHSKTNKLGTVIHSVKKPSNEEASAMASNDVEGQMYQTMTVLGSLVKVVVSSSESSIGWLSSLNAFLWESEIIQSRFGFESDSANKVVSFYMDRKYIGLLKQWGNSHTKLSLSLQEDVLALISLHGSGFQQNPRCVEEIEALITDAIQAMWIQPSKIEILVQSRVSNECQRKLHALFI